MSVNNSLVKVQVLNIIFLTATLICVILASWRSIQRSREAEDRNEHWRYPAFDLPSTALFEKMTTKIRLYYLTFLIFSLLTIPAIMIMSFYRNWKVFLVATSVFTFIWLIKITILLSSNEEYYNWLSTFSPVTEWFCHFFNALSCITSFIIVVLMKKKQEKLDY